ncbi:helix-turn-helix domain-containing protein [Algoriphagus yeomjeoni]|uniref:Helix-turn-helix protein n=1 Tax=Algoriphagus yeomjeoni TaxID=291403 RepID=A0A327PIS8_9BACT|nr:helix-turn-helix domain-containing protein [Algoriphagus yeomjeoni]RAI92210.1 helix-turn-helix protein [Algoriphagus yeomjeoni]
MNEKIHHGRNIKRFREMMGIKQESLAFELGPDWSQKKISLLEQKEEVEEELLRQVAEILKVPAEAIKSFNEEQAVNIIANTFNIEKDAFVGNTKPTFHINPLEEIKKLHDEKIALYERMLKEKDEMMARLEKLLNKQNP